MDLGVKNETCCFVLFHYGIGKINEIFEFTNFLIFYTKIFRYFHYTYYLKKDSINFDLEVSAQFGPKKKQYSQRSLDLYQFFMHNILYQNVSKFSFYILPKLIITWLTQFWVLPINFLLMNLNHKKLKVLFLLLLTYTKNIFTTSQLDTTFYQ